MEAVDLINLIMKKIYTYSAAIAIAGLLATMVPVIGNAQTGETAPTTEATQTSRPAKRPLPTPVQTRLQNAENNRDIRNAQLKRAADVRTDVKARVMASSTRPGVGRPGEAPKKPVLVRAFKLASSTPPAWIKKLDPVRARMASTTAFKDREKWKEARIDQFARLQKNLVEQGDRSLNRLKDLREKIAERIDTAEQKGRDMTEAKAALVAADAKIAAAEQAVALISAYVPPVAASTDAEVDASASVTLERPRVLGKKAIDAVNEAQRALKDVIRAIAQSMGLKTGQDGDARNATTTTATTTTP